MERSILDKTYEDFDVGKAQRELTEAQGRAETLKGLITGFERWRQSRNGTEVVPPKRGKSSRAQILLLMQEAQPGFEWTMPAIRKELGLDENAKHGIQVALSRLYRDGEVERVRQGVYRLPAPGASEAKE